jgi:hypothetical protein
MRYQIGCEDPLPKPPIRGKYYIERGDLEDKDGCDWLHLDGVFREFAWNQETGISPGLFKDKKEIIRAIKRWKAHES